MFTLDQIKAAHSKVKSGADFPSYIQDMKKLGVASYIHYVSDGRIQYTGTNELTGDAKWPAREIASNGDKQRLQESLSVHQQGQTDYPTFCKQAADAGVEKWIVDIEKMTCSYYNNKGDAMLVEDIPGVSQD